VLGMGHLAFTIAGQAATARRAAADAALARVGL